MTVHANSAERILEAALDLFSTKGYEGTSIRELCECSRITRPTLYYFYKSKEGVHRALVAQAMTGLRETLEQGLAVPGDLRAKCKAVTRLFFADAMRQPKLWRFIYHLVWSTNSPLAAELHDWYKLIAQQMARVAKQAAANGEVAPENIEVHLLVLMGATGEAFSNYLVWGRPKLTPKLADALIDAVFGGWSKGRE